MSSYFGAVKYMYTGKQTSLPELYLDLMQTTHSNAAHGTNTLEAIHDYTSYLSVHKKQTLFTLRQTQQGQ